MRYKPPDDHGGLITVMSCPEIQTLAAYNSEVARGWVHAAGHRWCMAILQWRYNAATREARLDNDPDVPFDRSLSGHFERCR
jgi:hypothetical protein